MDVDLKALRGVTERVVQNPDSVDGMADFVATFQPLAVLALLDRLEAMENGLRRIRDSEETDLGVYADFCLNEAKEIVGEKP